jgi:hypothetical protein
MTLDNPVSERLPASVAAWSDMVERQEAQRRRG